MHRCEYCHKEVVDGLRLCDVCEGKTVKHKHFCQKCGDEIHGINKYCGNKVCAQSAFDEVRSAFVMDVITRRLVHNLKFGGKKYVSKIVATYMSEEFSLAKWHVDMVCFVPAAEKSIRQRGYNQSQLICQEFCGRMGLKYVDNIVKIVETEKQEALTAKSRLENLEGVFEVLEEEVFVGKNVLIVDDVKTTGSTLHHLAKLIKKNKANKVYGLTFCSRR